MLRKHVLKGTTIGLYSQILQQWTYSWTCPLRPWGVVGLPSSSMKGWSLDALRRGLLRGETATIPHQLHHIVLQKQKSKTRGQISLAEIKTTVNESNMRRSLCSPPPLSDWMRIDGSRRRLAGLSSWKRERQGQRRRGASGWRTGLVAVSFSGPTAEDLTNG